MIVYSFLLAINVFTFYMYWTDKRRAIKGKWRIPENTLLILTLAGGSVGALMGMYVFRHKTKHWKFKILVPMFLVFHIALFLYFR